MRRKRPYTTIVGFGMGLIMWILEVADVSMPMWLLITLGVIALGMVIFGGIPMVIGISRNLHRIRFRTPITISRHEDETSEAMPQTTIRTKYSPQVVAAIDKLIQRGEELCTKMQTKDFSVWHVEPLIGEWLDDVSHKVWGIIPEYASHILSDKGDLTPDEQLRYEGWKWNAVALRISVDRRLAALREIRSQIRVADAGDSQN